MDAPSIIVDAVSFAYKSPVLQGLSLSVAPGEALAVLGKNGAGKTTLMRLIAGEMDPKEGRVRVCGGDPRQVKIRRQLGFIGEHPAAPGFLSAAEYLRYAAQLHDVPLSSERMKSALHRTGVAELERTRIANLSKGQVRRVELAALVALDPAVWILDEADSGLDPGGGRVFLTVMEEARARGRCLLVATHVVSHALHLATRILLIEGQQAYWQGTSDELRARVPQNPDVRPEMALESWLYPDHAQRDVPA